MVPYLRKYHYSELKFLKIVRKKQSKKNIQRIPGHNVSLDLAPPPPCLPPRYRGKSLPDMQREERPRERYENVVLTDKKARNHSTKELWARVSLNTFCLCFSPYFPSPIGVLAKISLLCDFLTFEFSPTTSCKYALSILSGQFLCFYSDFS